MDRALIVPTLLLNLAVLLTSLHPQEKALSHPSRYRLVDLGTYGGPNSFLPGSTKSINSAGTIAGCADTNGADPNLATQNPLFGVDPYIQHSYAVKNGVRRLLQSLPGGSNTCAQWLNDSGRIVGFSDTGVVDPLTGIREVRAVLWSGNGNAHNLGTLGGNGSVAWAINNDGQVTGNALNDVADEFNLNGDFGMVGGTQTHAFLWQHGVMQDLGTLGGPDSGPYAINQRGQVAGLSATSWAVSPTTGLPTIDPFFWDGNRMVDLGTLGGTYGLAVALNNRGQVIGNSNRAGDNPIESHAFLWPGPDGKMIDLPTLGGTRSEAKAINDAGDVTGASRLPDGTAHPVLWSKGRVMDLGVVPGDACGEGMSINSRQQVVGYSNSQCRGAHSHGFLWEQGALFDLNKLVVNPGNLTILEGVYITERGEIAGNAVTSSGDSRAVVLIPCDKGLTSSESCE